MKCPFCVLTFQRSTLRTGGTSVTLMGFTTYYDEDGGHHMHDPNWFSSWAQCSNGHEFRIGRRGGCCEDDPEVVRVTA